MNGAMADMNSVTPVMNRFVTLMNGVTTVNEPMTPVSWGPKDHDAHQSV
jgi:hypothetical protein